MNLFEQYVSRELTVPMAQFKSVLQRLLNSGVMARSESAVEAELYDVFVRCEEEVAEYLSLLDIQVVHNRRSQFVRLIPPGATAPGVEQEFNAKSSAFRQPLTQEEIDVMLVLRTQYEAGLRAGDINERGDITQSYESFSLALFNLLGRRLPQGVTERRQLFRRLRQMRIVAMNMDDVDTLRGWFSIRPTITSYVGDEVLQELSALLEQSENSDALVVADHAEEEGEAADQETMDTDQSDITAPSSHDDDELEHEDDVDGVAAADEEAPVVVEQYEEKSVFGEPS